MMKSHSCTWCSVGSVIAMLLSVPSRAEQYREAKVTVKVQDERGVPIQDAVASVGFSKNKAKGMGWGIRGFSKRGKTDADGTWSVTVVGNPRISYSAEKDGFYRTANLFRRFTSHRLGKWQPWNPTLEVVLQKIGDPVSMCAKRVETVIPVIGKPVGFDLKSGDWVTPHGNGAVADLVFTMTRQYEKWENFTIKLSVTFSNPGDGIQQLEADPVKGSVYRHLRQAPDQGYKREWVREVGNTPKRGRFGMAEARDHYLVFRVRSVADEHGAVKQCLYGKIDGGFEIAG